MMLLVGALLVIAFLPFALVFFRPDFETPVPLDLGEAGDELLLGGLRMLSPSFSGRTEDGEPYVVTADWALPNAPKPTRITLQNVQAELEMQDSRRATLTSEQGIYFPKRERLKLQRSVTIVTSDGYRATTPGAVVDVGEKHLRTDGEIVASGPRGTIRADSMEALDGSERIVIFRGSVRLRFLPEEPVEPVAEQDGQ